MQLASELGVPTAPSAATEAATLVGLYRENEVLSAGLDPRERGFGEDLLCGAVGALVRARAEEGGGPLRLLEVRMGVGGGGAMPWQSRGPMQQPILKIK